ncbi:MAG: allantoinase AllB [Nocardioidaceae bacterium]
MPDLVLRARRVVTADPPLMPAEPPHMPAEPRFVEVPASIVVTGGRIEAITAYDAAVDARQRVDLADDEILLPGLVDTHVHVNEPGRTEWEGFATATRAAAAGGVTTIVDMPLNSLPPTIDPASLEVKRAAAVGQVHVDTGFWGGAVPSNLGRLRGLHDAGVFGVKCFVVDSGVPEFPPLSHQQLAEAVAEVAAHDGLLLVHAEDAAVVEAATTASRGGPGYLDFLASRPAAAEDVAIARILQLAAVHSTRVHIVHLSSGTAAAAIERARDDGVRVTVETCPHYLAVAAEQVPAGNTLFKCCPPIREEANRDLLWRALSEGVIDAVVSDHSPSPPALKALDTGDFATAWGGISSLQLGFPLVWTEARRRGVDLVQVAGWMATGPARVAGLEGKGQIAVGADADFAVVAPDETLVVDPARLQHKHAVSPYAGRELHGVVRQTWLRGRLVHRAAEFAAPRGTLLRRNSRPDAR